jgi:hypothetical protein
VDRDRAQQAGISERTQRKQDALARQRPDLLEGVRAGQKSTDAAYREMRASSQGADKRPEALGRAPVAQEAL